MKERAFALVEMIIIVVIIAILAALLLPALASVQGKAKEAKCKSNLKQIGLAMRMYVQDYGRDVRYPDTNGGGFLARVYATEELMEQKCFICPGTDDDTDANKLRAIGACGARGEDTEVNAISYAGRKNANQTVYPGLFRVHRDTSLTSLGSDDWQDSGNHDDGGTIAVLYVDGHVDSARNRHAQDRSNEDQYQIFARDVTYGNIADPLTN